jgi:GDP/UDP-N,N'-diacetylbacillosamine 2-epimerase (hydrolysing)
MKLLFVTGSRGEWGYISPLLKECKKRKVKFYICASNMHLLDSYGTSSKEILKEGYKIDFPIFTALDGYNVFSTAKSLGILIQSLSDIILKLKPDWVILAGDRGETMAAAIVSAYSNIPIAHIQAGEVSGLIDGQARHAIGKFSHLHFASNFDARLRLLKLGEQKFRVKQVGAPQLDQLYENKKKFKDINGTLKKIGVKKFKKFILCIYHPPQEKIESINDHFKSMFLFLDKIDIPRIWISPNNDAGSSLVKSQFSRFRTNKDYIFDNLARKDYLTLLKHAHLLIGNSSSAVLEAPTFKTPCINIGFRQNGRLRSKNIIDVEKPKLHSLIKAYKKICSKNFKNSLQHLKNPYGDGKSAAKIINTLIKTKIDDKLLFKRITY